MAFAFASSLDQAALPKERKQMSKIYGSGFDLGFFFASVWGFFSDSVLDDSLQDLGHFPCQFAMVLTGLGKSYLLPFEFRVLGFKSWWFEGFKNCGLRVQV